MYCSICSQLQLQAYQPLETVLANQNTRLIFISTSTDQQTKSFLETSVVSVPGELYGDPEVKVHKLFALKRGIFRSIIMPLFYGFRKYGFRGILEGFRLGYETSSLAGDSWQQGGVVLLDYEGNVKYQHNEEHPADWSDLKQVFEIIGVEDGQINYEKALADWTEARQQKRN